ncbi:superoxide dismutase [Syncephalis plumigaleata]|nr:superoxide dismutase [Syncephalis plumigaleata]
MIASNSLHSLLVVSLTYLGLISVVVHAAEVKVLISQAFLKGQVDARFVFETGNNYVLFNGLINPGLKVNVSYPYHIHQLPVPADGNCDGTGDHLDPYNHQCEMGDLSGKFGPIVGWDNPRMSAYPFLHNDTTLTMTGENSIVNRSVVIHDPSGARIACGTIREPDEVTRYTSDSKSGNTSSNNANSMININIGTLLATTSTAILLTLSCLFF